MKKPKNKKKSVRLNLADAFCVENQDIWLIRISTEAASALVAVPPGKKLPLSSPVMILCCPAQLTHVYA